MALNPLTGEMVEIRTPIAQSIPYPGLAERRAARITEKAQARAEAASRERRRVELDAGAL